MVHPPVVSLLVLFTAAAAASPPSQISVTYDSHSKRYSAHSDHAANAAAWALFEDTGNTRGWGVLTVSTNKAMPDDVQAFAAGYAEGHATSARIFQHYTNMMDLRFKHGVSASLTEYMSKWWAWVKKTCATAGTKGTGGTKAIVTDWNYWNHVSTVVNQIEGMLEGYNSNVPSGGHALKLLDLLLINSDDDLDALKHMHVATKVSEGKLVEREEAHDEEEEKQRIKDKKVASSSTSVFLSTSQNQRQRQRRQQFEGEHCSSFIRVSTPPNTKAGAPGDPSDVQLLFGHTTWESYGEMIRIYKHYKFFYRAAGAVSAAGNAHRASFSSYPGAVSSLDDWFTLPESQLVVMETALDSHFTDAQFKRRVGPEGILLAWVRVVVANRLSHTGKEWASHFAAHNSGTANCQWTIIDLGRFADAKRALERTKGLDWSKVPTAIQEGTLYVTEQHIDSFVNTDGSVLLYRNGFYPGYNKPFLRPLINYMDDQYARARMFRRDAGDVNSVESLKALMLKNDFTSDPLSDGQPMLAIAPRGDLVDVGEKHMFGAIDSKVSSSKMFPDCEAINGPPHNGAHLTPFSWSAFPATDVKHVGQPDTFNFGWTKMSDKGL